MKEILRERREKQRRMKLVIMERMAPEVHFLQKVDQAVDLRFIHDLCAPLYSADNSRPAIDPEILFRMLLVGYLYGIKSEAQLERAISYNIAYKWFCRMARVLEDEASPILEVLDRDAVYRLMSGGMNAAGTPWFGQLMTGPQMVAYLLQVNDFLLTYGLELEL